MFLQSQKRLSRLLFALFQVTIIICVLPASSFVRQLQLQLKLSAPLSTTGLEVHRSGQEHENFKRMEKQQQYRNYSYIERRRLQQQHQQQQQQQQQASRVNHEAIRFNKWLSKFLREEGGSAQEAEQALLKRAADNSTEYDTISFNIVLSGWAKERSIYAAKRADALLERLLRLADNKTSNLRADTYSYSAVISAYAKSGGRRAAALRAEELLNQVERTTKITSDVCHNAVMDCWSTSGQDDAGLRAERWLHKLEEHGPPPTRISYNACIKAWARSNNGAIQANKILERMKTLPADLQPDKISYSTCIEGLAKSSNDLQEAARQAELLLREMEKSTKVEMRPDVVAYTSVLAAYAKAGMDYRQAMSLVDRMERYADQRPNRNFLNTLISLFAKTDKVQHAEALLKTMQSNQMADKITYTSVISAHANRGNATRAIQLLDELEEKYQTTKLDMYLPNSMTFASVLNAMAKSKSKQIPLYEVDCLLKRLEHLYQQTQKPELMPNSVVFCQVFQILSNSQDPNAASRAKELLQQIKSRKQSGKYPNLHLDAATYAYLINTFTKSRVHNAGQVATKVLKEVEEGYLAGDDSLKPTKLLYSAVLQAYAKSASREGADMAEQLLERTKQLYMEGKMYAKPTALYYNAVMDAHARSGAGKYAALRAEELLKELETRCRAGDSELTPKTRSYNAAILAWKNSNATDAPQRAEALLKRMNDRYKNGDGGCRPDRVTMNSIISVWAKSRQEGASERALKFLEFMVQLYQAGDESLKPDTYSFNSVIDAYSWCSSKGAAHRADELYQRMKKLYEEGDNDLRPDIITLTSLRNAWSRSDDDDIHAQQKLREIGALISEKRRVDRPLPTFGAEENWDEISLAEPH
jgi:pentatricopeptide repeat protein